MGRTKGPAWGCQPQQDRGSCLGSELTGPVNVSGNMMDPKGISFLVAETCDYIALYGT